MKWTFAICDIKTFFAVGQTLLSMFRPFSNTNFKFMEIGKACIALHNATELEYFSDYSGDQKYCQTIFGAVEFC